MCQAWVTSNTRLTPSLCSSSALCVAFSQVVRLASSCQRTATPKSRANTCAASAASLGG
ncbi:hypothetical protein D3C72_2406070 [compost metagenome]